jgi:hypothetical protein
MIRSEVGDMHNLLLECYCRKLSRCYVVTHRSSIGYYYLCLVYLTTITYLYFNQSLTVLVGTFLNKCSRYFFYSNLNYNMNEMELTFLV